MKLLTKLGALGSCWNSPPHHSTLSGFDQEDAAAVLNPHPKRRSSSAHWRPALTAISEDHAAAAALDERRKTTATLVDKERPRPRKAISKAPRVKPSGRNDVDSSSWKVQAQIAIPAFSPTPFMF